MAQNYLLADFPYEIQYVALFHVLVRHFVSTAYESRIKGQ